jgi:hypothetical protein
MLASAMLSGGSSSRPSALNAARASADGCAPVTLNLPSGGTSSDAVVLFGVTAVAWVGLVSSAVLLVVGSPELRAGASAVWVGCPGGAAFEADVGSPVGGGVVFALVPTDASVFEAFFKSGQVSSFSPFCSWRCWLVSAASLRLSPGFMVPAAFWLCGAGRPWP